jgi:hypothetical protein
MVGTVIVQAATNPPPGTNNLSVVTIKAGGTSLTLTWQGGTPPYIVQQKPSLTQTNWSTVMTTTNVTATVPLNGAEGFFRISEQAAATQ